MPFSIHITSDFDQMSQVAARLAEETIAEEQADGGDFVLGLATGSSPTGLYKHLAKAFNAGRIDATRVRSFNLDEYAGLPGENAQQRALHPESYSFFMVSELFGLVSPRLAETNVPWGTLVDAATLDQAIARGEGFTMAGADKGRAVLIDPDADGYLGWVRDEILTAYADKIAAAGGIDLHIIGVGGRGHVAFHETGIPFQAGSMLLVKLDDDTVANAVADGHFATPEESPKYAISFSAQQVFKARRVMMVASGGRKTGPVAEAVLGAITPENPLSYGQQCVADGGDLVFVLDETAAAGLLEDMTAVRARGIEVIDHRGQSFNRVGSVTFSRCADAGVLV